MSRSPQGSNPSGQYETAWTAITELIHGESSWSGRERNVAYLNNGDGTFSDISGASGLDFVDDSRAYAAADFDGDGDLDLGLKSRNEPGIRVLRNDFAESGGPRSNNAIMIRARGSPSNRDAVGARVTVLADGMSATKTITAGSGFLSQRSKELGFGLGQAERVEELRIRWPSGTEEVLLDLPINRRIEVAEGSGLVSSNAFSTAISRQFASEADQGRTESFDPDGVWLVEPVAAPKWKLPDTQGVSHNSTDRLGSPLLLNVWATWCPPCRKELRGLQEHLGDLDRAGLQMVAVSVDDSESEDAVEKFAREEGLGFPVLLADSDFASAYNLLKRHLLNRRTDLRIPSTFLVNSDGFVEKIYEGAVVADQVVADAAMLGEAYALRLARATPFDGRWFGSRPRRNAAELGAALLGRGLVGAAVPYFEEGVATMPDAPHSHYNLATAYVRQGRLEDARACFERALKRNPDYPEAHNSLGVVLSRLGEHDEAIVHFRAAIEARADYAKAIGNLATAYARTGKPEQAVGALEAGIDASPGDPTLWNRLGTFHARRGNLSAAEQSFREALRIDPADADAVTNLALLDAQRGSVAAAVARLEKLLASRSESDRAYLALAQIHASVGDMVRVRDALARLLARNPAHGEAQQMLKQLEGTK